MSLIDILGRLSRSQKRALQMTADSCLVVISFLLAMFMRLESWAFLGLRDVWFVLVAVLPLTLVAFLALDLYRSIVRYQAGQTIKVVVLGALGSAFVMVLATLALDSPVPRSVPGIYALVLFVLVVGIRYLARLFLIAKNGSAKTPVIVYGAGDAGRQLAQALRHGPEYAPVAFVDDDPALQGTIVGWLRVYAPQALATLIADTRARAVLLAIPSASRAQRRGIVEALRQKGLEIKTIPGMADIVSGKAKFSELRAVRPEDLLGRDPIEPDAALMRRNVSGKVVLVTGAGGSIGSELCRQIVALDPARLVLLDVSEFHLYSIEMELRETLAQNAGAAEVVPLLGSVQNPGRVRAILKMFGVQTIYHAAAYKHVPLVEENVIEGVRNNVFGTQTLVQAAIDLGVENFILISTDKAVRPTNVMGASKRLAELVCQAQARDTRRTLISMVRFGNVLGSSGSVIPRFSAQIGSGGPVTVTHRDINRYFMTIPEAAQLVIQAGAMAQGGDVYVLDMGEPVRIIDLATTMVRLHGLEPYVIEKDETPDPTRGDIAIQITGLRMGEKLYEELLIGDNPQPTAHPRILTASEVSLDSGVLKALLDRLLEACLRFDFEAIRAILLEAPLAYQPSTEVLSDLMLKASVKSGAIYD